jgi:hypothetical protein
MLAPGLEIDLDTTISSKGKVNASLHQIRRHRTVGLPANPQFSSSLQKLFCEFQAMPNKWCWIAAKETNAAGCSVNRPQEIIGLGLRLALAVVPVLTEKAVESASLIEDCQIGETMVLTAATYPVGNAISRQWIVVPISVNPVLIRAHDPVAGVLPHAAISEFAFCNTTSIDAHRTFNTAAAIRRNRRQSKWLSRSAMDLEDIFLYFP